MKSKTVLLSTFSEFKNGKFLPEKERSIIGKYEVYGSNGIIAKTEKYLYEKPVIVIGRVGANCGVVNRTKNPAWITDNCIVSIPKSKIDFNFLYYKLKILKLNNLAIGSAQPMLTQDILNSIEIISFDLSQQQQIGKILYDLDSKIKNLQSQNKILEQIAHSIFKSWFVDFDGVTEFEDSELGKIPKGWKIGMLGDVAENIRDSINPKQITTNVKYIGLEHMPRERIFLDDWDNSSDSVMSNKFQFKKGDILFGKLRPYFRKVGISPISGICSTDILVINPKDPLWLGFVLCIVSSENFINFTDSASHGTRMPRTDWETMKNFQVIIPDLKSMKKHNHVFSPILNRAIINVHLIHDLMQIRDSLLPKLMSGEIRV